MPFETNGFQDLIGRIYEAAVFSDLWPEVLESVAQIGNAVNAGLFVSSTDQYSGSWAGRIVSPSFADACAAYMNSDIPKRTQLRSRLLAWDRPAFGSTSEVFSPEEWETEPFNKEFARPWGFGHAAATAIRSPSGEFMVVHLNSPAARPDFSRQDLDRLDALRPHLARATLLATRWRLERLQIADDALAAIGLPALVADASGRVLAANALIKDMTNYVSWLARDGVALTDPRADRTLRLGLLGLNDPASSSVRSFATRSRTGKSPVIAHLVPTPGLARDLFDGAVGILVLTPVTPPEAPDTALIRDLFDLTPREASVARAITLGLTIDEMAARDGVARETVRGQVKAVLGKTGTRRQCEVAALFRGLLKLPVVSSGSERVHPRVEPITSVESSKTAAFGCSSAAIRSSRTRPC